MKLKYGSKSNWRDIVIKVKLYRRARQPLAHCKTFLFISKNIFITFRMHENVNIIDTFFSTNNSLYQ